MALLVGDVLRRQASPAASAGKRALTCGDRSLTYGQLDRLANQTARALIRLGLQPGDRLAILDRNSIEWVVVYFAAARAGLMLVPLSFWHRTEELQYAIDQADASAVVASPDFAGAIEPLRRTAPSVKSWLWLGDEAPDGGPSLGSLAYREPDCLPDLHIDEHDPHIMLYTSGTTGYPKGAVLSHRAHVLHAITFALYTGAATSDTYLNVYPLFHTGGTDCAVLPYMTVGATVVLLRRPSAEAIAESIEAESVTAMMAVPTLWRQLLDLPDLDRRDLRSLTRAMGSSDAMPRDLLEDLLRRLPVTWTQTYGLTEAGCILTYLPTVDQFRKLGSVGKPHHHAELAISGPNGPSLRPGDVGEVLARTEHMMMGYWRMPEATAEAMRDGWLHTGDLGRLDDDGYLYITGRLKDMIVSGGEKIYSAEVESVLAEHPAVAEVAIVGVPDAVWGEAVLAIVVPRPGLVVDAATLQDFVRRRLAGFKRPRYVVFVEALPRTAATGKVQKAALRKEYAHLGQVL